MKGLLFLAAMLIAALMFAPVAHAGMVQQDAIIVASIVALDAVAVADVAGDEGVNANAITQDIDSKQRDNIDQSLAVWFPGKNLIRMRRSRAASGGWYLGKNLGAVLGFGRGHGSGC